MTETLDTIKFTPEKSKQIALARLDLIHKWHEFRRKANNKLQADYDFVNLHNIKLAPIPHHRQNFSWLIASLARHAWRN